MEEASSAPASAGVASAAPVADPAQERRLARLEHELRSLRANPRGDDAPPAAASTEITPAEAEQRARTQVAQWQRQLESYEQEPVDAAWADQATAALQTDVAQLAEDKGFHVVETRCKSTHCSAVVEWPDFATAGQQFNALLHQADEMRCARETVLLEPEGGAGDAPYRQTVLYDCTEVRGGG